MRKPAVAGGLSDPPRGIETSLAERRTGIPGVDNYLDLVQSRPSTPKDATLSAGIAKIRAGLEEIKVATPPPRVSGIYAAIQYLHLALNFAEGKIIGEDQRPYRRLLEVAEAGELPLNRYEIGRLRVTVAKALVGDHDARQKLDSYLTRSHVARAVSVARPRPKSAGETA